MNFKSVEKALKKYFDESLGIDFELDRDDDMLEWRLGVASDAYDDPIDISIILTQKGSLMFCAQFDGFTDNEEAYPLINRLNADQPVFKAFINEDGRLELQHFVIEINDDDQLVHVVDYVITRLVQQPFVGLLQPLTDLTE